MIGPFSFPGWIVRFRRHRTEDVAEGELNVHWHIHRHLGPAPHVGFRPTVLPRPRHRDEDR